MSKEGITMINKLINIFDTINQMEETILANYVLEQGIYFIIRKDNEIEGPRIIKNGETIEDILYEWLKKADFYSQLLRMEPPAKDSKQIYSNNYLSLFMKSSVLPQISSNENTLTQEELFDKIEIYYEKIKIQKKEKNRAIKKALNGKIIKDEEIKNNKEQLLGHISTILEIAKQIESPKEGCLKIFFEDSSDNFKKEYQKYLISELINRNQKLTINKIEFEPYKNEMESIYLNYQEENIKYRLKLEEALTIYRAFEWLDHIINHKEMANRLYLPKDYRFQRRQQEEVNLQNSRGYLNLITKVEHNRTYLEDFEAMYKIPQIL